MPRALVAAMLSLSVSLAPSLIEAQPPEVPPEQAPEPARPDIEFALQPTGVTIIQGLVFGPGGQVNRTQDNVYLGFNCVFAEDATALAFRDIHVDRVVTDSGEVLINQPTQVGIGGDWRIGQYRDAQGRPCFSLQFATPIPSRPTRGVREIKGRIIFVAPVGPLREVRVSPLDGQMGQWIRLPELGGKDLKLVQLPDGAEVYDLSIDHELNLRIREVSFVDAQGVRLPIEERGEGRDGNLASRRFLGKLPEGAAMVIRYYESAQDVEVPFVINDIPLPGQDKATRASGNALRAEPDEASASYVLVTDGRQG